MNHEELTFRTLPHQHLTMNQDEPENNLNLQYNSSKNPLSSIKSILNKTRNKLNQGKQQKTLFPSNESHNKERSTYIVQEQDYLTGYDYNFQEEENLNFPPWNMAMGLSQSELFDANLLNHYPKNKQSSSIVKRKQNYLRSWSRFKIKKNTSNQTIQPYNTLSKMKNK